jgi:hypothetical protein
MVDRGQLATGNLGEEMSRCSSVIAEIRDSSARLREEIFALRMQIRISRSQAIVAGSSLSMSIMTAHAVLAESRSLYAQSRSASAMHSRQARKAQEVECAEVGDAQVLAAPTQPAAAAA